MKHFCYRIGAILILALVATPVTALAWQAQSHIDNVYKSWPPAPDGMGLMAVAEAEARTIRTHAGFMISEGTPLPLIKRHAVHVLHAIDPELTAGGPGLGFGLDPAARAIAREMALLTDDPEAPRPLREQASHVATGAANVMAWCGTLHDLVVKVVRTSNPDVARKLAVDINHYAKAILSGLDKDGDGTIGWQPPEGGMAQMRAELERLATAGH